MATDRIARLEDFGTRGVVPPAERLKEYQEQSKGLHKKLQARFWLEVLDNDREVAKLVKAKDGTKNAKRKR